MQPYEIKLWVIVTHFCAFSVGVAVASIILVWLC